MAAKTTEKTVRRTKKAVSPKPAAMASPVEASPICVEDEIRRRAYEIYLERGSTPGSESEDWLLAEREVRSRAASAGHSA